MFTRTAKLFLSTLLAAAGCTDALDDGEEVDTGPLSTGDENSGADEFSDEGQGEAGGIVPKSDEPPPEALLACDIGFACEHPLELIRDGQTTKYEASDVCALAALASGQIALIQTVAVFPNAEAYRDHVIEPSGAVLRQAHGYSDDLGLWQKPVERCTLQGFAFFADCAKNFDARCLDPEHWIVADSCQALGSLTCPAP
jgi:hypothetical protein